jgi:hypothetical protein
MNDQDHPKPRPPLHPGYGWRQAGPSAADADPSRGTTAALALGLLLASGGMLLATGGPALGQSDATPAAAALEGASASCAPGVTSPPGAPSPAPAGAEVALSAASDLTGERTYTLGDTAKVEEVVDLQLLEAWRGWSGASLPAPEGQTTYTFLVRFAWDGTQPQFLALSGGYYNVIAFSMRDDEDFEYPVLQAESVARQPILLYGEVAAGQAVQGWLTFHGPADAAFVELTYQPLADSRVFFRVRSP